MSATDTPQGTGDRPADGLPAQERLAILGATGCVGRALAACLQRDSEHPLRCLSRDPSSLVGVVDNRVELESANVLEADTLPSAFAEVHTLYYLVHLMHREDFEAADREAAQNTLRAARDAGVRRIVYLSGLGEASDDLSPHLRSRQEVGEILRSDSEIETIELRAAVVLGSDSLSFQVIQKLTQRLPVMLCPQWVRTRTQPIAESDVVRYLSASKDLPSGESRVYEIGGSDVVSYADMIQMYAKLTKRRRVLIPIPVLTPSLSGLWLGLVTPAQAQVARHLALGLKNPTVVTNDRSRQDFDIEPLSTFEAMRQAIAGSEDADLLSR